MYLCVTANAAEHVSNVLNKFGFNNKKFILVSILKIYQLPLENVAFQIS